jgi:tetratricopeptide (TPR) repeat protein
VIAHGQTAAVLPFGNDSNSASKSPANLDWIGESIAETLRDALASHGVLAIDRDDIQEAYRRLNLRERALLTQASVIKVGEAVDAEYIVFGTFEFQPSSAPGAPDARGSIKVSVRVVDRKRMRESSDFEESGALEDLATVEAHLAWRALTVISPKRAPPESEFRSLRAPIRLDAEENYVRGLISKSPEQREKYFTQAARLDPRFGRPCFQLGQIYYQRREYRVAADWLEKVGPENSEYHRANFVLGLARFQAGDYAAAQKAFQTVAVAVPLSAVLNNLAAAESRRNLPQAADDFRKALDSDPSDPIYHFNAGYALFKRGDFVSAADRFRAALDRDPNDQMATLLLGRCLKKQGLRPDGSNGDSRFQNLERLKTDFEEKAYLQLKSLIYAKKPEGNAP